MNINNNLNFSGNTNQFKLPINPADLQRYPKIKPLTNTSTTNYSTTQLQQLQSILNTISIPFFISYLYNIKINPYNFTYKIIPGFTKKIKLIKNNLQYIPLFLNYISTLDPLTIPLTKYSKNPSNLIQISKVLLNYY